MPRPCGATPTASSPAHRPQRGDGGHPAPGRRARDLRDPGHRRLPRRDLPPGADQRQADVPGLRQGGGAGHPRLLLRRHPRPAPQGGLPARGADRRGDVRLPGPGLRHPTRLPALDGAGGEADAQVAGPALLDQCLRTEVLPLRHRRLRQHPWRRQDHLRRLLPDGAVPRADPDRAAVGRLQGRGVAEVPPYQRPPGARHRLRSPVRRPALPFPGSRHPQGAAPVGDRRGHGRGDRHGRAHRAAVASGRRPARPGDRGRPGGGGLEPRGPAHPLHRPLRRRLAQYRRVGADRRPDDRRPGHAGHGPPGRRPPQAPGHRVRPLRGDRRLRALGRLHQLRRPGGGPGPPGHRASGCCR